MSFKFTYAQSQCSIRGEITAPQRDYIVLHYADNYWLRYYSDTIKLRSDNTFNYIWRFSSATKIAMVEIDNQKSFNIWCANNETLAVNIADSGSQMFFSGSLGKVQQYLQTEQAYWTKTYNSYKKRNPDFENPTFVHSDGYYIIQDSITLDKIGYLNKYFTNSPNAYEKLFLSEQKDNFIYQDLYYKLSFNGAVLSKFKAFQTLYNVKSPVTYKFSEEINFNKTSLLYNQFFLKFARSFFIRVAVDTLKGKKVKFSRESLYSSVFGVIDKASKNAYCNSILKAAFINDQIDGMKVDLFEEGTTEIAYRKFVDLLKTDKRIQKQAFLVETNLNENLNELYSLKKGTASPKCLLIDSSGNTKTWDDFKDKTIYIDVWASWCGPCIKSFPNWNGLVERFKKINDIVFITISIDDSKDSWLKALNKYRPGGLHFLAKGGWDSEFAKKFKIYSVPANILIDKKGRIINLRADRPENIDLSEFEK